MMIREINRRFENVPRQNDFVPGRNHSVPKKKHPVPGENHSVPKKKHPVLGENHSVPRKNHPVLRENHSVLGENHSAPRTCGNIIWAVLFLFVFIYPSGACPYCTSPDNCVHDQWKHLPYGKEKVTIKNQIVDWLLDNQQEDGYIGFFAEEVMSDEIIPESHKKEYG